MTGYVIRRILWLIPLMWAVATITFLLMHAVPGGPFASEKPVPPSVEVALNARYHLDEPLWNQYLLYFQDLLQGDLGISFRGDIEVIDLLAQGLPVTLQLGCLAFLYAIIIGMSLGIIAALNHNRLGDYLGVFFSTIGTAMPSFVIATFLIIIFSVELGWTGVLGWGGPDAWIWEPEFWNPTNWDPRNIVLPVISLGTLPAAYIARITRASMLDVLGQDYIRTARAKGLRENVVVLRHAVKNAMVPILTVLGPIFAFLVTGSFIIEQIFAINGVGRHFVTAVFRRDYGVIMGVTLFYAFVVAIANLVVDILYATVDPRIRYR
ncbi:MAG: ABC transporter permease [Chloroflexi bacterium]|nr:ABC transporter permease [Chloroflexota bacterium]MCI0815147.1 ABC transporter permease [Chloroflexota bacterium]MCI0818163.1 ABC transporter permease [Chloroflexota bacterium]MCI0819834.1 ABC transporter permease [Chloroflexota bacterium]MCI0832018.1 ABC transporter permease [Chloroflexota bacterium]